MAEVVSEPRNAVVPEPRNAVVPVVRADGDRVFATSHDVAGYFQKEHRDVLRAADSLRSSCAELRTEIYERAEGEVAGKALRWFEMTRTGFTLLAMGFTGEKAVEFKLRYIREFDRMEAELRRRAAGATVVPPVDPQVERDRHRAAVLREGRLMLETTLAVQPELSADRVRDVAARILNPLFAGPVVLPPPSPPPSVMDGQRKLLITSTDFAREFGIVPTVLGKWCKHLQRQPEYGEWLHYVLDTGRPAQKWLWNEAGMAKVREEMAARREPNAAAVGGTA
jgi:Rha family phage regulatory protein